MASISSLHTRRQAVAQELLAIRSMRKGNINEQYVRGRRGGKAVTRGPYPVLCWREGKKVVSERLRTAQQLEQARQDIANHKRFKELCKEFEELTQRLGQLEREEAAGREALKKGLKSRSSRAGKSRG